MEATRRRGTLPAVHNRIVIVTYTDLGSPEAPGEYCDVRGQGPFQVTDAMIAEGKLNGNIEWSFRELRLDPTTFMYEHIR